MDGIVQIDDQFQDIEVFLDTSENIWNKFGCIRSRRFRVPFVTDVTESNAGVVYALRLIIASIAVIIATSGTDLLIYCACSLTWIIIVIISLFDCNYSIFLDGLATFNVYYKVINTGIGVLGEHITFDWYKSVFDESVEDKYLYLNGIIVVAGNMLFVFVISVLDGYPFKPWIKFMFIVLFLNFHIYRMILIYSTTQDATSNFTINLGFNNKYNIDWRVAAISCIFSTLVFVSKQYLTNIIQNRATVVSCNLSVGHSVSQQRQTLIPSISTSASTTKIQTNTSAIVELPQYKERLLSTELSGTSYESYDYKHSEHDLVYNYAEQNQDINQLDPDPFTKKSLNLHFDVSEGSTDLDDENGGLSLRASKILQEKLDSGEYKIFVHGEFTLACAILYYLCRIKDIHLCIRYGKKIGNRKIMYSCCIYCAVFLISQVVTEGNYLAWIHTLLKCLFLVAIFITLMNINYQIFYHQMRTFISWWKLIDVILLYTGVSLINSTNKLHQWSFLDSSSDNPYDYNKYDAWIVTIVNYLSVIVGILCICAAMGFIVFSQTKFAKFVLNFFVFMGVFYYMDWSLVYGKIDGLNYIWYPLNNKYSIDLKHAVALKGIDLSLWFFVQFIRQIKFGDSIKWEKIRLTFV